jgi:hypothetical protein
LAQRSRREISAPYTAGFLLTGVRRGAALRNTIFFAP